MAKVRVVVFFTASNTVDVEVPDEVFSSEDHDALPEYVQEKLNKDLPEVLEGCTFEFPTGFQVGSGKPMLEETEEESSRNPLDGEFWDLKG